MRSRWTSWEGDPFLAQLGQLGSGSWVHLGRADLLASEGEEGAPLQRKDLPGLSSYQHASQHQAFHPSWKFCSSFCPCSEELSFVCFLFIKHLWDPRYMAGTNYQPNHTCISSVQFSDSVVSDSLRPHGLQHARPPCPSPTPRVYSNSYLLSQWCHPTISSSVIPFSSRLQSFPTSASFPVSQLFASGGQSIVDYNAVLISSVCKSDSVIYIYICICIYIYFFFRFFSIVVNYRILNIVPCTTQQDLVVYLLYIILCIC